MIHKTSEYRWEYEPNRVRVVRRFDRVRLKLTLRQRFENFVYAHFEKIVCAVPTVMIVGWLVLR